MTKTLTEQWREGNLESGWYYTKHDDGKIYVWLCFKDDCSYIENPEVKEILAPVPSYDMWTKHRKVLTKVQIENCDLKIINEKLKGQLEIATKALKEYERYENGSYANKALALIKEVK